MKILAIVITYNGIQWIDKCIGSLYSSNLPVDVIVVDNLSTDGTPEYIAQNFPKVELVRSKENLGFAGGNNIGLQKAINENYDYIFLLNQ